MAVMSKISKYAKELMIADVGGAHPDTDALLIRSWQEFAGGLSVDGIAGPKTLRALWERHKPSADVVVERAFAAAKWAPVRYQLGSGGSGWLRDPDDPLDECDCSGFIAHCLGRSRNAVGATDLGATEWVESTQMVRDATGPQTWLRAFPLAEARPGDIVVYGDREGRQGHCGIVVGPAAYGADPRTIDCGQAVASKRGAIAVKWKALWGRRGAIVARPVWYGEGA